ncbi:hypothetical protein EDD37DRAFT_71211 [Exophiala viscosa]|uniref:uncharacterized protein n=1 Tax=Exophiala viscosa TaxID=2486360 RepID=UPI002193D4AC|nr:hypothetical protein EDD37DRAFT_71211 [Exophiala viscosa]
MAILDKLEVTISSDGREFQEYEADADEVEAMKNESPHKDSPHIVKYIEAIPGAEFQVNYTLMRNFSFGVGNHVSFHTRIDGETVCGPAVTQEQYDPSLGLTTIRGGVRSGKGYQREERSFYWRDLVTTDEKTNATPDEVKEKYGQLGTIRVIVSRKSGSRIIGKDKEKKITLFDNPVPEKALKGRAIDSTMGLQAPRASKRRTVWSGVDIDKCPLAVFIFLYRSGNALQVLDILPRTPEPVPLEARDPDSLTLEEARELARRQKAHREASRAKIKKEEAENNLRQLAAIQVKREATDMFVDEDEGIDIIAPPPKKLRREPEVIDLSD